MGCSPQNYNVFNKLKNMKRFPEQLQSQNTVPSKKKEILPLGPNSFEESEKMFRKMHTARFVPIQILLSENVKILES
jgi:hypothetical protein